MGRVAHLQQSFACSVRLRVPHPCVLCKGGRRCRVCYLILLWTVIQPIWRRHFRFPPFVNNAWMHLTVLVIPARSRNWGHPPRYLGPNCFTLFSPG